VRRAEREHSGPFEQIDYVVDPVIGGRIGAAIGFNIGYSPSAHWTVRYP